MGPDVFASAVAVDKDAAKRLLCDADLPIVRFRSVRMRRPLPSCGRAGPGAVCQAGSARRSELPKWTPRKSLLPPCARFRHDRKVLVEECMRGCEVECGVIEEADGTLMTSDPPRARPRQLCP